MTSSGKADEPIQFAEEKQQVRVQQLYVEDSPVRGVEVVDHLMLPVPIVVQVQIPEACIRQESS